MKKLTIIGLLVVLVAACVLLYWRHVKIVRFDSDFRQNLAGTWVREVDNIPRRVGFAQSTIWTNIVAPDGSYICLSWFMHPDRTNTYRQTGTWLVRNGHLIQTIKTSTNPTEVTPWTNDVGRIVRADARGFIVRWQGSTNEAVWQRVIQ
jgi:hypothetical protein